MGKSRCDTHHISSIFDATINAEELMYFFLFISFSGGKLQLAIYLISLNQLVTNICILYFGLKTKLVIDPALATAITVTSQRGSLSNLGFHRLTESKHCYSIKFQGTVFRKHLGSHGIRPQQKLSWLHIIYVLHWWFIHQPHYLTT